MFAQSLSVCLLHMMVLLGFRLQAHLQDDIHLSSVCRLSCHHVLNQRSKRKQINFEVAVFDICHFVSWPQRNQLTVYSVKCQICTITVHIVSWHRLILRLLTMSHHRGDFCFLSLFLSFHCVVCFLACSDFSLVSHGSPARICNQLNGLTQHYADLPDWQKTLPT